MRNKYKGQITKALHHINMMIQYNWTNSDSHSFESEVNVALLADMCGMSVRNFRIHFEIYTRENVGKYTKRIRLEYALQLLSEGKSSLSEIADRIGLANDTALYNIFRKKLKSTPANYKANFLSEIIETEFPIVDCKIIDLPSIPVLFLSYIGDYDKYISTVFEEDSWDRLYDYALSNNILPETEEYWGICYDDTDITDAEKCRFYACMTIATPIKSKLTDEIKCMTFPSRQYAVFTHNGSYNQLDIFYKSIIQNIPQEYDLDDGLILEHYLNSVTDIPETELLTEVLLPVIK